MAMTLRTSPEDDRLIEQLAAAQGTSKHEAVLAICDVLGIGPVMDVGLLDSALQRPRARLYGLDAYVTLEDKAAALMESVVRHHALTDGNERLGWACLAVFLDLNRNWIDVPDDEAFNVVMRVAAGYIDREDLACSIRSWMGAQHP